MHHQDFDSPKELQDSIKCFWYFKREFGETESDFEVIPDGNAEIIFYFGDTLSIYYNGEQKILPSPFLVGLLNEPIILKTKNCLEVIGIRCYPWTVFDLLKLKSGKNGLHVFEHPIAQLQAVLSDYIQANKIEEAIDYLKQYFLDQYSDISINNTLHKAGTAMTEANGSIPVSQVAEAAHSTIRTLERKFKQSSGHTIKDVSALIRFEQVRNQLWIDPDTNLAGLAHELGYTDQSHLSREFKRYSSTTPAAFARNAKKEKQAVGSDFVAFVQS